LGTYGIGTCRQPCQQQTQIPPSSIIGQDADTGDWGIYTNNTPLPVYGWTFCDYSYNFSQFTSVNSIDFLNWLGDVYKAMKNYSPTGTWIGPIGSAQDPWQARYYCTDKNEQLFSSLQSAQNSAAGTICTNADPPCNGSNSPLGIMANPDNSAFQYRCGQAIHEPDGAGFGNSVYTYMQSNSQYDYPTIFRDTNILYSTIFDIYNMIYNTGPYLTNPQSNSNQFRLTCSFLSDKFSDFCKSQVKIWLENAYNNFYSQYPQQIQDILTNPAVISLPIPKQDNDTYNIVLNLSFPQYYAYSQNPDIVSSYLQSLLQDSKGQLYDGENQQTIYDPVITTNPNLDSLTFIDLTNFTAKQGVSPNSSLPPNYFFASAQITCTVQTWSPMLLLFFCVYGNNIQFSSTVCDKIKQDCGLYPLAGYTAICSDDADVSKCKNLMIDNCGITYSPPSNAGDRTVSDSYLMTTNATACLCYTSGVAPLNQPQEGNNAAMCFSKDCDARTKTWFGLDESTCLPYCDQVWGWMNSQGNNRPRDPQEFDSDYFRQVCGTNYSPLSQPQYNKKVAICGISITIIFTGLVYLFCQSRGLTGPKIVIPTVLALIFATILTVFFAIDLAGKGSCKTIPGKFICRSKISGIEIPDQFCDFKENCECNTDQDCPGECICVSTTCLPKSGNRQFKMVEKSDIDIAITITVVICIILLFFVLVYINRIYKFSDKVFYAILFLLGIVGIVLLVVLLKKKTKVQEFASACGVLFCNDVPCTGESCINDNFCVTYPQDCPMKSSTVGKISINNPLPSGNYLIQYKNYNLTPIDTSQLPQANTLYLPGGGTSQVPWTYNSDNYTISGKNTFSGAPIVYICAQDFDNGVGMNYCGNTAETTYAGGLSAVSKSDSYATRFIITSNTIYSIDANAYVIPDQNTYPNFIPPGYANNIANQRGKIINIFGTGETSYSLTYTTDPTKAAVWTITGTQS
jgi:hypothetical protein